MHTKLRAAFKSQLLLLLKYFFCACELTLCLSSRRSHHLHLIDTHIFAHSCRTESCLWLYTIGFICRMNSISHTDTHTPFFEVLKRNRLQNKLCMDASVCMLDDDQFIFIRLHNGVGAAIALTFEIRRKKKPTVTCPHSGSAGNEFSWIASASAISVYEISHFRFNSSILNEFLDVFFL